MKNVILIDDRVNRQIKYLNKQELDFNNLKSLKNITEGKDFDQIKEDFIFGDFSFLNEFEVIMIHRSAFETNIRNSLLDNLRKTGKKVVFFSGGISGCQISTTGKLELLMIHVDQFYSENLFYFLKNGASNLLELAFGKNWQLSTLVDIYEKLSLYLISYKERPWVKIEDDLKINNWIKEKYFHSVIQNHLLMKSDIEKIMEELNMDLKQLL